MIVDDVASQAMTLDRPCRSLAIETPPPASAAMLKPPRRGFPRTGFPSTGFH
jgi:hypothetical protein